MSAYFQFQQFSPAGELKKFVLRLDDERNIAEARAILNDSNSIKSHVQGTIVPNPAPYNPDWSFHLDPALIGFFEFQTDVCDSNVTYVEEHLDSIGGSFPPNSFWCPWSCKLEAEVTESGRRCQSGLSGTS